MINPSNEDFSLFNKIKSHIKNIKRTPEVVLKFLICQLHSDREQLKQAN